jgi:hypothetical protein
MRRSFAVAVMAAVLSASAARAQEAGPARALVAPVASAQRFGSPGSVAISVERLFGASYALVSGGSNISTISLLGPGGLEAGVAPYSIPRLAVDAFLEGGLTLGLGAEFARMSEALGTGADLKVFGIHPRVGFLVPLDGALAFWPRAGVSYVLLSSGRDSSLLAFTVEPQLVITAVQHVAFTVTPTFDIGLAATDQKVTQLGIQVGVLGWF